MSNMEIDLTEEPVMNPQAEDLVKALYASEKKKHDALQKLDEANNRVAELESQLTMARAHASEEPDLAQEQTM